MNMHVPFQGLFQLYVITMLSVAVIGLGWKLGRYIWLRIRLDGAVHQRTATPYPIAKRSWGTAFWMANGQPYTIWMKANPVMFIGHTIYHVGLFGAMGIYALVTAICLWQGCFHGLSFIQCVWLVCDWPEHMSSIFAGYDLLGAGIWIGFLYAVALAAMGIATPFVMTALGKRGMSRPIDEAVRAAGIKKVPGLKSSSRLKKQRKLVGLMVVVMDWLMFASLLMPISHVATTVHVSFAFTLVALIPTSFLFHEIYRVRMFSAVLRYREGRV